MCIDPYIRREFPQISWLSFLHLFSSRARLSLSAIPRAGEEIDGKCPPMIPGSPSCPSCPIAAHHLHRPIARICPHQVQKKCPGSVCCWNAFQPSNAAAVGCATFTQESALGLTVPCLAGAWTTPWKLWLGSSSKIELNTENELFEKIKHKQGTRWAWLSVFQRSAAAG
jgi:hypothetical protein